MSKSPVAFVVEHLDACPRCSVGDFCPTGIQLMYRGAEAAAAFARPIPSVPRSKVKA